MPVKMIDPNLAASMYANTSKIGSTTQVAGDDGVSFSDFLKSKISDAADSVKGSEKASAQAITGDADITDVVQAVTSAEISLQTIIAVRDRLIGAYQEIMRMPI